jgi:hypothetical protein
MSDPGPPAAPKLIIDDDWKSQAQAEKERLSEAEAVKAKPAAGAGAGAAGAEGEGELPPADFQSLVGMLITQALMYMGGVADRQTGRAVFDPEMSRFYIDLLGVVESKTKGNLSEDESRDLLQALSELRTRYIELMKMIAAQMAQAKAGGGAGGFGGPGAPIGPGMTGGPGGMGLKF